MLFGLILTTKKGFYLIKLLNVMILFVPIAFMSFTNYWAIFLRGNFSTIMEGLSKYNNEKIPSWIFFFLKYLIGFFYICILIGFFYQLPTHIENFGLALSIVSLIIIILIIHGFFFHYFKYKNYFYVPDLEIETTKVN